MQELEKILEEIGVKIAGSMGKKREGLLEAEEIIRKHLSRENDSETMILSRDTEGTNEEINLSKEEFDMLRFDDSVTFRCGNEYVSLYMWEDEATRKYKHMNDGWIPVEKDLPKNESEVWVVLESTYGTGYRTYSSARYLYFENYGEGHWCDEHYGYLEWDKYSDGRGGSSQYKVIAWQSIAPYRPERSEE